MALRNQPYLPLYIKDFLTDEKLIRCSAESTGVYIRLMCLMHKSDEYGKFIIKEKDIKSKNIVEDFAKIFSLYAPYPFKTIFNSFNELIEEGVLFIKDNKLCQKRMIKDNELSEIRGLSGKKGMINRYLKDDICYNKNVTNTITNDITSTEYEYEDENEIVNKYDINIYKRIINYLNNKLNSKYRYNSKINKTKITARLNEGYKEEDFYQVIDKKYNDWYGGKMQEYLVPETLFGNKFEKYLNSPYKQKTLKEVDIDISSMLDK